MPIANYTTSIEANKTIMEIQRILVQHGAKEILLNYDEGIILSLSFIVETPHGNITIRLPVNPHAVLRVLEQEDVPNRFCNYSQAVRIAWRIAKDWVRAQMAILETEMVKMEEIFLPYMIIDQQNTTLYEAMQEKKFYLTQGENHE